MQTIGEYHYSYEQIEQRDKKLREINYECTLNKYHSKNQTKYNIQPPARPVVVIIPTSDLPRGFH